MAVGWGIAVGGRNAVRMRVRYRGRARHEEARDAAPAHLSSLLPGARQALTDRSIGRRPSSRLPFCRRSCKLRSERWPRMDVEVKETARRLGALHTTPFRFCDDRHACWSRRGRLFSFFRSQTPKAGRLASPHRLLECRQRGVRMKCNRCMFTSLRAEKNAASRSTSTLAALSFAAYRER